jgi:hypothetical protein
VLNAVYEEDFLGFSYGFRPGRGQHQALDALAVGILRKTAPGTDGVTWQQYGERLEDNLRALHARLRRGSYRARPFRRAYIPKADGRLRPLGIAALEDKIVLDREVCLPKPFQCHMVCKSGELRPLVSAGDLTHPFQRTRHTVPALRPGCVLLARVPLGLSPSLHCLRRRSPNVVRQLLR